MVAMGRECVFRDDDPGQPCWGDLVDLHDAGYSDDGGYPMLTVACQGHKPMVDGDPYWPEPKLVVEAVSPPGYELGFREGETLAWEQAASALEALLFQRQYLKRHELEPLLKLWRHRAEVGTR